jgi:D-3-phosphoglycerate dehydrogenase
VPPDWRAHAGLLARAPELLVVSTNGAGYDTVDLEACTAAGVLAVNQAGGNAEGVAEHTLAMMIALLKRFPETERGTRRGTLKRRGDYLGRDLFGRTVGLVGLGHVGTRVAALVGNAFRCPVLACDPYLDAATMAARGARKVDLPELLAESEVVSFHCPHTAETAGMFGAREFAAMRPGAVFVTTARHGIHDEAALHQALASGHLAGAGLDVWDREPPPPDHPLLALDTVICTPHMAGVTVDSRERIARFAVEQLLGLFAGERPPRLLNPAAWPRFAERFARFRETQA